MLPLCSGALLPAFLSCSASCSNPDPVSSLCFRWFAKDSYWNGVGLDTFNKDVYFKQPYLPTIVLPSGSSVGGGSSPAPAPAVATATPPQCGSADCIVYTGCFNDMVGGVRAVPSAAIKVVMISKKVGSFTMRVPTLVNAGWTPLTCANEAKKNGAVVIAIQGGDQCYYGTDLSAAIAQGPATTCTAACTADATQSNCGGSGVNSVYTVV